MALHSTPTMPVRSERHIVRLLRQPLLRLLAINLAIGLVIAVLAVAGLLALDAHRLRSLILGDQSPVVAVGLLLFGFAITLGSWVMGSAIMRLGDGEGGPGRAAAAPVTDTAEPVPVRIGARARRR
ncbi:hypothetical protein PQJ75_23415 [Rhodoplanes sp. TEM]|uniref:Uncharacterized protein n=1 Tax=Rhodoplanes tepidamans TaxID=200616 RepID=A0ABT5J5R6_RHOTP|nr:MULTISPECIES: hypothetical protein [Rhodoplanes]MDC7784997.1 hypothetical protein [Rhodoplanes tepidamans]MDC7986688.1 hypothetical protein [Rhodoplanes sp. TEM]MDQ0353771.1 hypothetical protein [Rhodoplanes tepidamans]